MSFWKWYENLHRIIFIQALVTKWNYVEDAVFSCIRLHRQTSHQRHAWIRNQNPRASLMTYQAILYLKNSCRNSKKPRNKDILSSILSMKQRWDSSDMKRNRFTHSAFDSGACGYFNNSRYEISASVLKSDEQFYLLFASWCSKKIL